MSKAKFTGQVETRWMTDGRRMRLLKGIKFKDKNNVLWKAPKGSIIDGASIPRELWSMIGSPFVGKHRRASVIHDVACMKRTQPFDLVHYMFYEAMLCDGMPKAKANFMYIAVRDFGPRWDEDGNDLLPEESLSDDWDIEDNYIE